MPHTVIAWSQSIDNGGVFLPLDAVPDQHVRVAGDSIFVPEYNVLVGAAAFVGSVGNLARLVAPSLRRINPYYIEPCEELLIPGNPAAHGVYPGIAVPLDAGEQIMAENNSNPAAVTVDTTATQGFGFQAARSGSTTETMTVTALYFEALN